MEDFSMLKPETTKTLTSTESSHADKYMEESVSTVTANTSSVVTDEASNSSADIDIAGTVPYSSATESSTNVPSSLPTVEMPVLTPITSVTTSTETSNEITYTSNFQGNLLSFANTNASVTASSISIDTSARLNLATNVATTKVTVISDSASNILSTLPSTSITSLKSTFTPSLMTPEPTLMAANVIANLDTSINSKANIPISAGESINVTATSSTQATTATEEDPKMGSFSTLKPENTDTVTSNASILVSSGVGTIQSTIKPQTPVLYTTSSQTAQVTTTSNITSSPGCVTSPALVNSAPIEISSEETNCLRISVLLFKVAPRAVRKLFDKYNDPSTLRQNLKQCRTDIVQLKDRGIINQTQWETLFPRNGNPVSTSFDLSLMISLLRQLSGISAPSSGWNKLPVATDNSVGAHLVRIKHYRNMIAHKTTCSMNKFKFRRAWEDIEQAVNGIGEEEFAAEIKILLTIALDQSYKEMYIELKEIQELTTTIRQSNNEIRGELDILKQEVKSKNDAISQNIKFRFKQKLASWKDDDENFVITRATNEIISCIEANNCLVISGPPGSGKSVTMQHVALLLKAKGYTVCPVHSPDKILEYWMREEKQVFIFDDPLGKHTLDMTKYNQWQACVDDMQFCSKYSDIKFLFAIRTQVIIDPRLTEFLKRLQTKSIGMNDENMKLSKKERLMIFKKHTSNGKRMNLGNFEEQIQEFDIFCFPLLCRMVAADRDATFFIDKFFNKPIEVLEIQFNSLKIEDPCKYFCLILCLLYDNNFDANVLSISKSEFKQDKKKIKIFLELCEVENTPKPSIKKKLDSLLGTFLIKESSKYKFIHDIVHDAVINHLPEDFYEMVIHYCSSKFFRNRILLQTAGIGDVGTCIVLKKDLEKEWAMRLLRDAKEGNWHDVFHNKSLLSEHGDRILANTLCSKDSAEIEHIMCTINRKSTDPKNDIIFEKESNWSHQSYFENQVADIKCKAIHWILLRNLHETMNVVLKSIGKECRNKMNENVSFFAIAYLTGIENNLLQLIRHGFDVDEYIHDGKTLLHVASECGDEKIAQLLINHKATIDKYDNNSETPLYLSSVNGHDKVVKLLISHQADVNKCEIKGGTPLHVASWNGYDRIAQLLIRHGADVNKCNEDGETPLHISSWKEKVELDQKVKIVDLLVRHGADVNKKTKDGRTPLYCSSGFEDVKKILTDNGAV